MFLYIIALEISNKQVRERFQHSSDIVSKYIKEVLKTVCLFTIDVIKPEDPSFTNTL